MSRQPPAIDTACMTRTELYALHSGAIVLILSGMACLLAYAEGLTMGVIHPVGFAALGALLVGASIKVTGVCNRVTMQGQVGRIKSAS